MPVQLFGIGEAAFHRFFPAFVNLLAARLQTMSIHPVSRCLPHLSGHALHHIPAARALRPQRAIPALTGVGVILPVTFPSGRAIHQQLLTRTYIHIAFGVIAELAFGEQALSMVRCPISCDPVNPALLQPFGDRRRRIPRIQPDRLHPKPEPLALPIQPPQIRHRVMHRRRCRVRVSDDRVLRIYRAMVQVEESLRLALAHHVAASWSVRLTLISFVFGPLDDAFSSHLPSAARSSSIACSSCARYSCGFTSTRTTSNLFLFALAFRCVASVYSTLPSTRPRFIASSTISSNSF